MRRDSDGYCGFLAVAGSEVLGHIVFAPATLDGSELVGMGLAPTAVDPQCQNRKVGIQSSGDLSMAGRSRRSRHDPAAQFQGFS